jgi:hypothetical protein
MVVEAAQVYTEINALEERQAPQQPEENWQGEHAGNGAAREPEDAEPGLEVDTVAAGMARATQGEEPGDPAEDEEASETEESKGSFARRFVARREARRSRKTGGTSLSDRLRGLVAERHDT